MNLFYFDAPFDCFLLHSAIYTSFNGNQYCFYVVWRTDNQSLYLFVEVPNSTVLQQKFISSCSSPIKYYLFKSQIIRTLYNQFNVISVLW